jgi:dolichyl-phosphate-mannose--protein O-mannosyl transferase
MRWEVILVALLLTLTVAKLYYRLETPREIVWDETHFTKFSVWCVFLCLPQRLLTPL